jgi:hypothetical protein
MYIFAIKLIFMNPLKILILVCAFSLSVSLKSQTNCIYPIPQNQFNQLKAAIFNSNVPNQRFQRAISLVSGNCISTNQMMEIMNLFQDDRLKLDLAMGGYRNITNPLDFYDVYNQFSLFSSAFRLHDFVNGTSAPQIPGEVILPTIPAELIFPNWSYPSLFGYMGVKNCVTNLADSDFLAYARDIQSRQNENDKLQSARLLVSGTCLSTAQVMKLTSLLSLENARLEVLKSAYDRIFDEASLEAASQVFAHQPNQLAWVEFIKQKRNLAAQQAVIQAPCSVTEAQYAQIKDALTRESSSITRVNVAKNQIPVYSCFTSQQMKGILSTFSSSIDKLEIAKLGYDNVSDKQNYYFTVIPVITSSIDRDELSKYIAQRGR